MITLAFIIAFVVMYCVPGFVLARGMYAQAVRELNARPVQVVPPKPPRPRVKMNEMLHDTMPRSCALLRTGSQKGAACTCRSREDWLENKNAWIDYHEWNAKYGHITNGVVSEPTVNMVPIYLAVPGWPVVAGAMFIKGGAKNIPDYRAIERIENELKELS